MNIAWLYRHGFLFATLTPAERAAKVRAARERIAAAERQRRADREARHLAKAAKLRKGRTS